MKRSYKKICSVLIIALQTVLIMMKHYGVLHWAWSETMMPLWLVLITAAGIKAMMIEDKYGFEEDFY